MIKPSRGRGDTQLVADILNQNKDTVFTRLIHNSISPADVSVDYRLVNKSQNQPPDLQLSIRLKTAGNLQYADLGSVYLFNFDMPQEGKSRPAWLGYIVMAFKVLLYTILGIIALLFMLRWCIRTHRMLKHKRIRA
jgi:hypothetical protein